jgi:flagellar biosynthesis protein
VSADGHEAGVPAGGARKQAVAIRYDPADDVAPTVVGKGQGYLAERIVELAKEHGIYVHTDPNLVALLMDVQLDEAIPPQLYQVVAKVLGLVYRVNRDLARKRGLV